MPDLIEPHDVLEVPADQDVDGCHRDKIAGHARL
jgi:hypothetical protein